MATGELYTDGNEAAGVLQQIFALEVTTAERTCQSCHAENPIGAHRLHRGAGMVLRCPNCGDVAATITELPSGYALSVHGTWVLGREP
ncbi:MAG TPA: DUF6510 family protein [Thermoleophilaceae bacterium]|jgi:Zn finger protein HypA/HybF involved in hydrogenase expression